jgi:hypothetical protein
VSVLSIVVVVPTTQLDATLERHRSLLEKDVIEQFSIPGRDLTVTVLPGLSILSGDEHALASVKALRATFIVDSLKLTRELLERTGCVVEGSLGSGASMLARDPDGNLFEFVEGPH